MVLTMVDMERSYLTADVFREIIQQGGDHENELIRTLSGRKISDVPEVGGDPGQQHMRKIAVHVSAYITHVRTQLKQTIPKAIVHCLVQQAKKKLLAKLQEEVASKEDMALKRMLSEDEGTIKRRTQIADRLKLLKNASQEVAQVQF